MSEFKGYALFASIAAAGGICLALIVGMVLASSEGAADAPDLPIVTSVGPVVTVVAELVETVRPTTSMATSASIATTSKSPVVMPSEVVETSSTSEAEVSPETAAVIAAWSATELSPDSVVKVVGSRDVGFLLLKEAGTAEMVWVDPPTWRPLASVRFVDIAFHAPTQQFAALGADDNLYVAQSLRPDGWDPVPKAAADDVAAVTFNSSGQPLVLTRQGVIQLFAEGKATESFTGFSSSDGTLPFGVDGEFFVIDDRANLHHLVPDRVSVECGVVGADVFPIEVRGGVSTMSDGTRFALDDCTARLVGVVSSKELVIQYDGRPVGYLADGAIVHEAVPDASFELEEGQRSVVAAGPRSFVVFGLSGVSLVDG